MTRPVQLTPAVSENIKVAGPFSAKATLIKPSHFPSPFDMQTDTEYRAVTFIEDSPVGVAASFEEGSQLVHLALYAPHGADLPADALPAVRRRLGLDLSLPRYKALWDRDETLSRLPRQMIGARPASPWSLYEYLTITTILQNTTVARTVQMANALADSLGTKYSFPDGVTLFGFWRPGEVVAFGEQSLREARLGYRAKTLVRVGAQFLENPNLERDLRGVSREPDGLRAGLRQIYGVGPSTTGYLMFDVFKSLNELTHLPPWESKILGRLLFEDDAVDPSVIINWCQQRWAPYTMLATHAIFESIFWQRKEGNGPAWLDKLIRM